jgi:hypothetical protein
MFDLLEVSCRGKAPGHGASIKELRIELKYRVRTDFIEPGYFTAITLQAVALRPCRYCPDRVPPEKKKPGP